MPPPCAAPIRVLTSYITQACTAEESASYNSQVFGKSVSNNLGSLLIMSLYQTVTTPLVTYEQPLGL